MVPKVLDNKGYLNMRMLRQGEGLCGPTCLKTVLNYYGRRIPMSRIVEACSATSDAGCGPEKLVSAARCFGFDAEFFCGENPEKALSELKNFIYQHNVPPILDIHADILKGDRGHYIVARGFNGPNGDTLIYGDPRNGSNERRLTMDELLPMWFDWRHSIPMPGEDIIRGYVVVYPRIKSIFIRNSSNSNH